MGLSRRWHRATIGSLLLLVTPIASFANMKIATKGNSLGVVVVAEDAIPPEEYAAEELVSFLSQVTGASFELHGQHDGSAPRLLVGAGAARLAEPDFTTEGLGKEGIVIRTVGDDLILAGGAPRGTLYAVYTFLEEVVGCRWWTPMASYIPSLPELKIPELDHRHVPRFEYRETYWSGWVDADWGARMKHNGARSNVDERRGGKFDEVGGVHSYDQYLPPDRYFDDHPEWYSLLDGERASVRSQLCLTNEEMRREFVKNVVADIREKASGQTMVWVSQNDHHGYCECNECRMVDEREGGPTGTVIYFANAVAEDIARELDDVSVKTLAYDYSQKPPDHLNPDPKVIIELCSTGVSYLHPYTHGHNRQFRERLRGWGRMTNRIYIWDYLVNFTAYLAPHPNIRTLGPNVKFFARNGVAGIFAQGAYGGKLTELSELRQWLLLKLYWDPSLEADDLIDEFLAGYYGPAGEHIRAYIDAVHDAAEVSGTTLAMSQSPFLDDYLSFQTMSRSLAHLDAAAAAVAGDLDLTDRVDIASIPVLHLFLLRWDEYRRTAESESAPWPLDDDIAVVYNRYIAIAKKHGIEQFAEANLRGTWPSVAERVAQGPPQAPPGCEDKPPSEWQELQNRGFVVKDGHEDHCELMVDDPKASDGSAVRLEGGAEGWPLYRELWRAPLVVRASSEKLKLRCYVSVRCEVTGTAGPAFRADIASEFPGRGWTAPQRDDFELLEVAAADVQDGEYHTYDLGLHDNLGGWINLRVAAADNPDNVRAVYVDRAWLVAE